MTSIRQSHQRTLPTRAAVSDIDEPCREILAVCRLRMSASRDHGELRFRWHRLYKRWIGSGRVHYPAAPRSASRTVLIVFHPALLFTSSCTETTWSTRGLAYEDWKPSRDARRECCGRPRRKRRIGLKSRALLLCNQLQRVCLTQFWVLLFQSSDVLYTRTAFLEEDCFPLPCKVIVQW